MICYFKADSMSFARTYRPWVLIGASLTIGAASSAIPPGYLAARLGPTLQVYLSRACTADDETGAVKSVP